MEILVLSQLRLMCLFFSLMLTCVSTYALVWIKEPTFDNKASAIGDNVMARSRVHCGNACAAKSTCVSFFFAPGKDVNCQLHDSILTSPGGLTSVPASTYYISEAVSQSTTSSVPAPQTTSGSSSTAPPFTCPPDDSIFRTVQLGDGNIFTYRVFKVLASQSDAATTCGEQGGFLARVTSVAEMSMLLQLMECTGYGGQDYYVDGSNAAAMNPYHEHAWIMSNGDLVPMSETFWGDDFPNHADYQHCFRMRSDIGYKWDDCTCDNTFYFICEK